jgi:peroxiredoxin Q/BCP
MVKTPNVDEKAPDFDLPRDGGSQLRLSSLAGKKVVLYFYPKDDTPGCTLEGREFSAARSEFSAADAVVIGLSADSVARHDKFKAKHDLDIALVSDEDHEALNAYGVWVEKNMYGRKSMGIERATYLIDREGRIACIWRKVKVNGHVDEVLEAARALP